MEDKLIGFHNPKLTTELLKTINERSKIKFEDSSWGNDLTDSVYNEENDIFIYLPNSEKTNYKNEEFSRFLVIYDKETPEKEEREFEFSTIDEVIEEINKNV